MSRKRNCFEATIAALPFPGRSFARACYMMGHLAARRREVARAKFAADELNAFANEHWPAVVAGLAFIGVNAAILAAESSPQLRATLGWWGAACLQV